MEVIDDPSGLDETDLAALAHIEKRLGMPAGFYASMRDQGSDWEFSIKLIVILEAALASVITAKLHNDAVADHVEALNIEGGRTGKLALAEALGVISPLEKEAFSALAWIRNRFAHKVSNVSLDLPTFAKTLETSKLEKLQRTLLMLPKEKLDKHEKLWRGSHVAEYLRLTMFMSGAWLAAVLADQDKHAAIEAARIKRFSSTSDKNFRLADLLQSGPTALTATREELNQMFMTPAAEPKPS